VRPRVIIKRKKIGEKGGNMASIVRAPEDNTFDFDYLAFSFDGLHSYEDFGIYRVSDGEGYNLTLTPELSEHTAEAVGRDGQYYFNTYHKSKTFNIKFAFEDLSEMQLKNMKKWFNGKKVGDLWFAESPYKVYSAKVNG
jgi:phage-related protein